MGKGRQISGIIIDNYVRGRKRAAWVTTSTDLYADALRDFRDLGCHIPIIQNLQALDKATETPQEGVLFLTYSTLTSTVKGKTRLAQLVEWLNGGSSNGAGGSGSGSGRSTFDGALIFDECHKAKNSSTKQDGTGGTKVSAAVIHLQRALPAARVVYCSATGVTDISNLAYAERLGLWGKGSAFPSGFPSFLESMKKRGVSILEVLAMELKRNQLYVSRGLSFLNAEFAELECFLTDEQRETYDAAAWWWRQCRYALTEAVAMSGGGETDVWKPFWGALQRFFKLLCVSMKIPGVIEESNAALASGCAVIIGLQSTGEAATDALGMEPNSLLRSFVSMTKEMARQFVNNHFPITTAIEPARNNMNDNGHSAGNNNNTAAAEVVHPECLALRTNLLEKLDEINLPPNPLDELIDKLGGKDCVAEMTGRKSRIVRESRKHGTNSRSSRFVYELRAKPDSSEMDSLNIRERQAFMDDRKLVAIVSDAASTGISLHADRRVANQKRRVHMTIELPWSADKAIQQLGRSHRSNQVTAPLYKLVFTNLGGERRFAAAVARRLQSLGALTKGDRRAASGLDLSEFHLDSTYGRKALRKMYDFIIAESPLLPKGVNLIDDILKNLPHEEAALYLPEIHNQLGTVSVAALTTAVKSLHSSLKLGVEDLGIGMASSTPHHTNKKGEQGEDDNVINLINNTFTTTNNITKDNNNSTKSSSSSSTSRDADVKRFLNRLLGASVSRQTLLFNYFMAILSLEISAAKAEGRYVEGVSDLPGKDIRRIGEPSVVWKDPVRGDLVTRKHVLAIERGCSYGMAVAMMQREAVPIMLRGRGGGDVGEQEVGEGEEEGGKDASGGGGGDGNTTTGSGDRNDLKSPTTNTNTNTNNIAVAVSNLGSSGFYKSRREYFGRHLYLLALNKPGSSGISTTGSKEMYVVVKPYSGQSSYELDRVQLLEKYAPCQSPEEAEHGWTELYEDTLKRCMHNGVCAAGDSCQVGRRVMEITILEGSVIRIWDTLERVLERNELKLPKHERSMKIVRVELPRDDDSGGGGGMTPHQLPSSSSLASPLASQNSAALPLIGVKYPSHLINDVVETLMLNYTKMLMETGGGGLRSIQPPQPSAAAASMQPMHDNVDQPTPVDQKLLKKAFNPAKTIKDFFKPAAVGGGGGGRRRKRMIDECDNDDAVVDTVFDVEEEEEEDTGGKGTNPMIKMMAAAAAAASKKKPSTTTRMTMTVNKEAMASLLAMGFAKDKAESALLKCKGDVNTAADWLLSNIYS